MHQKHLLPFLLALAVASAACQKENEPDTVPEATPKVLPAKVAIASIASVQILEDCPDAEPAKAADPVKAAEQKPAKSAPATGPKLAIRAPAEAAPGARSAPADWGGAGPPCLQSTIQVTFKGQGDQSSTVKLKQVRLLTPGGKDIGGLLSRMPSIWGEGVYTPWDAKLQPNQDAKVSYKITSPDWTKAETILGGPTHGKMFVLEAVIDIDGKTQKVRSQQFARFWPEMIPT